MSLAPHSLPSLRRFTVDEYHRLGEAGILAPDDRVELLQGLIASKIIHSPRHDATVSLIEHQLRVLLPAELILRTQSSITTDDSEPEPDLAIVAGPPQKYRQHHPRGSDIALVVEVADSSLARDRLKASIYAAEQIPEYWIVNLRDSAVEVFRDVDPGKTAYRSCRIVKAPERLEMRLPGLPTQQLNVEDWFEG